MQTVFRKKILTTDCQLTGNDSDVNTSGFEIEKGKYKCTNYNLQTTDS